MATILSPPDQRIVLHNVSWDTYEHLLADLHDSSAPRLTYDRGTLEITSPSSEHERYNRTIAQIVEELAVEMDIHIENLGSTTFRREDIDRGFEPDTCFYVQNARRIQAKRRIDLAVDPPPDLLIGIDITNTSIDKLPIFAEVGVREVWCFDGGELVIYELTLGKYIERDKSSVFIGVTAADINRLIKDSEALDRPEWVRTIRSWARDLRNK